MRRGNQSQANTSGHKSQTKLQHTQLTCTENYVKSVSAHNRGMKNCRKMRTKNRVFMNGDAWMFYEKRTTRGQWRYFPPIRWSGPLDWDKTGTAQEAQEGQSQTLNSYRRDDKRSIESVSISTHAHTHKHTHMDITCNRPNTLFILSIYIISGNI